MTCFMFPGQPLLRTEMQAMPAFDELACCCQDKTGFNPLSDECSDPGLSENVRLQLFGVTMSLHRYSMMVLERGLPDVIAEHSMGIYPALAASRSLNNAEALELTFRIGKRLTEMSQGVQYALASVVGLAYESLNPLVAANRIYIANHNTSRHFLVAGERSCIETFANEAAAAGAFSTAVFGCDAPLHTPLIREIAADLQRIVNDYDYKDPQIPLVDHLEQRNLTAADVPGFLVEELCRPVFWDRTYRALIGRGLNSFHEIGAGSSLTKFNRWIDSER
ncbi:ACP S-malonyltransferase [Pelotalea chapellei]